MIGELPRALEVCGVSYPIRSNYGAVLDIIVAFNDPDCDEMDKMYICLDILFETLNEMPPQHYKKAYELALRFIDCNKEPSQKRSPKTMDWEQDESILFPAINKVAGFEVREAQQIHWFTFMGYFQEIEEGLFSTVVSIRQKKAKGKKLEKHEKEFLAANKELCTIKRRYSDEEQKRIDAINALFEKK